MVWSGDGGRRGGSVLRQCGSQQLTDHAVWNRCVAKFLRLREEVPSD